MIAAAAFKLDSNLCRQVLGGLFAGAIFLLCGASIADDAAAAPSRHQLMKDCMHKQVAADSGKPRSELRSACKDLTSTEKENADAARKAEQSSSTAAAAPPAVTAAHSAP